MKDVKPRIPKNEKVWVSYYDCKGTLKHILTSKPSRDYYYLYEVNEDGELNKLGKARTPPELEKKFGIGR